MAVKDVRSPNHRDDSVNVPSLRKNSDGSSQSHGVVNKPFDEALEFSQSDSDDSVDTKQSEKKEKIFMSEAKSLGPGPSSLLGLSNQKPLGGSLGQGSLGGKIAVQQVCFSLFTIFEARLRHAFHCIRKLTPF